MSQNKEPLDVNNVENGRDTTVEPVEPVQHMGDLDEDFVNSIPTPPDGGWGWVIVAVSLMCNIIVDGIVYSYGVFLPEFVSYFGESRSKVSLIGSLLCGIYLCVGPIVGALTNKYGCRPVTMVGSVIATIAFILATLSPNVDVLIITYGVLGGFGFGLIYLPSIVSVGYYFERKRAIATGIALCGSGIGTFIFAPFTKFLLDEYNWKNALYILAGIVFNGAVCGALMRPLEPTVKKPKARVCKKNRDLNKIFKKAAKHSNYDPDKLVVYVPNPKKPEGEDGEHQLKYDEPATGKMDDQPVCPNTEVKSDTMMLPHKILKNAAKHSNYDHDKLVVYVPKPKEPEEDDGEDHIKYDEPAIGTLDDQPVCPNTEVKTDMMLPHGVEAHEVQPLMRIGNGGTSEPRLNAAKHIMARAGESGNRHLFSSSRSISSHDYAGPMYKKDIFYSGSVQNLHEYKAQPDVPSYIASITSIPTEFGPDEPRIYEWCSCLPKPVVDVLHEMCDVSLFTNIGFMCICLGNVFAMCGYFVPYVYIVDRAMLMGIDKIQAPFLLSVIGITNTIGRVVWGILADRPQVNSLLLNNLCMLVASISIIAMPFCNSYAALVGVACVFGLTAAAFISLTSIIICDLLGLEKLTNAFGLLTLARGLSSTVGPPIAGFVFKETGSYDASFFLGGCVFFVGALLHFVLFLPCLKNKDDQITVEVKAETTDL